MCLRPRSGAAHFTLKPMKCCDQCLFSEIFSTAPKMRRCLRMIQSIVVARQQPPLLRCDPKNRPFSAAENSRGRRAFSL